MTALHTSVVAVGSVSELPSDSCPHERGSSGRAFELAAVPKTICPHSPDTHGTDHDLRPLNQQGLVLMLTR
jgi:hypothetical protein